MNIMFLQNNLRVRDKYVDHFDHLVSFNANTSDAKLIAAILILAYAVFCKFLSVFYSIHFLIIVQNRTSCLSVKENVSSFLDDIPSVFSFNLNIFLK